MRTIGAERGLPEPRKEEFHHGTDVLKAAPLDGFASAEEVLYEIGRTLATLLGIAVLAHLIVMAI